MHKGNYEMQFWISNQRYATLNLPVHVLIGKESFRKLLQSNFGLVIDLFSPQKRFTSLKRLKMYEISNKDFFKIHEIIFLDLV